MTKELVHVYAGEIVAARITPAPYHPGHVTGYGRKIPIGYMLQVGARWHRVYVVNYGNAGSTYIARGDRMTFLSPGVELILETIRDGGTIEDAQAKMNEWPQWMKDSEKLK